MKRPIGLEEALARKLVVTDKGIHTFSNGTQWELWAAVNCLQCWFYPANGPAGIYCAFEGGALLHGVTPELARMFGWKQNEKYADYDAPKDEKGLHRHGWHEPDECAYFFERPDDEDGDSEPPPPPDPAQLVLIADPTEDAAMLTPEIPVFQEVGA